MPDDDQQLRRRPIRQPAPYEDQYDRQELIREDERADDRAHVAGRDERCDEERAEGIERDQHADGR